MRIGQTPFLHQPVSFRGREEYLKNHKDGDWLKAELNKQRVYPFAFANGPALRFYSAESIPPALEALATLPGVTVEPAAADPLAERTFLLERDGQTTQWAVGTTEPHNLHGG